MPPENAEMMRDGLRRLRAEETGSGVAVQPALHERVLLVATPVRGIAFPIALFAVWRAPISA